MVATTLRAGDLAVIGYNTGQTDVNGTTVDSVQVVLLRDIGSGTTIFLTDRTWTATPGSSVLGAGTFSVSGTDGTTTYTAGADMTAGTVINIPLNGGFNPEQTGESIYLYQGAANAPTVFMFAIDIADNNTTFNGSLVNTGLTNGVNAVAVRFDSGAYHGPTTGSYAHLYNGERLLENIADTTNWNGDDAAGGGTPKPIEQQEHSGPYNVAPDLSLWMAATGGGAGIASTHVDGTVGSGQTGYNFAIRYSTDTGDPVQTFASPRDIAFDTVEGRFFFIDSTAGEDGKIYQGNISDLHGNPATPPTMTLLYSSNQALGSSESQIRDLQIDVANNIIYFTHGQRLEKIVYNTANQTSTVLANFGTASGNPNGTTNNFMDDFVINFATGNVYLTSHRIIAANDGDAVTRNYVYRISGLDPADGTNAFTFGNGLITVLPMNPDDDDANNGINFAAGEGFPQEEGTLEGVGLSPDGNTLYFAAATTLYDHDGDGGVIGGPGTDPLLLMGGVFSYALTGNPTGLYTQIWQQLDDGDTNSQAISEVFGPQGILDDLEVDPITGEIYFLDVTGDQLGISNPQGDEGIWRIDPNGTDLQFIQSVNNGTTNTNALGANGIWLNRAPTVTSSTQATPGVTEASSSPGSGLTALVQPFLTLDVTDVETASLTSQLANAVVYISNNFQSGATHQDRLTINGATAGTLDFGAQDITFNYNSSTGAMTLSGQSTFNNYEAAIALVRFNTSGDDVTAYGAATTRTISWSVSDGLNHSEEVSTTVNVTGINDAPVNVVPGAQSVAEDGTETFNAANSNLISVSDVDADPATQALRVTMSVTHGALTLSGTAGLVFTTGDGTADASLVFTGAANAINAALNGLIYTPTLDYHGSDSLSFVVNDQGFNGNDPGNSGTGTTEEAVSNVAITVTPVVDIANDTVNLAEDAGASNLTLLANDTFENSDRAITAVGAATHGTATINDNGTPGVLTDDFVVYTPTADYNGADSFTYTVTSGGATEQATVNVNLSAVADIANDTVNFAEDAGAQTLDLLANDTFENSGRAITAVGAAAHGVAAINDNGTPGITSDDFVVYTQTADYNGTDSFTYTVTSPAGVTEQATVNVTISAVADILDDTINVNEDSGANNLTLLANDTFENSGRAITAVGAALHGTTSINNAGTPGVLTDDFVVYTPTGNYAGADSFTYTVTSGGVTEQATANITVVAINDAPVNTIVGALNINEDALATNVTGISISDQEADPAVDLVSVILTVANGTLAILDNVAGGIAAGNIVAQTANSIAIQATINQINTTLAAAGGLTYKPDANFSGSDNLGVYVNDEGFTGADPNPVSILDPFVDGTTTEEDFDEKTITVAAVDDPATTVADADDVDEDGTVNIDVLANDSDVDTTLAVVEVDGQAIALGATITLTGSGATVKRELDGTLTYNPNDQFNYLITAAEALATGAVNDTATDTFSYELAGGETANVTVTVHGVDSPEDVLMGDGTDNTINGTGGTDFFYVMQAGTETLDGMGGNDAFLFGAFLDATDDVDGGAGTGDQLGIQGDYSGGLTLGANNLNGIETFVLLSGTDTRFGEDGLSLYDYDITTVDANVPNTGLLKVQFNTLVAGEDVSFDGSDESSGAFFFYAGQGVDTLIGGGGNDAFFFGHNGSAAAFTAADQVDGGGGNNDQLGLRGDYANLITFGSTTMENVEVLVAISSTDPRFGNTGSNFHYNLKTHNDNVGATKTLSVTGAMLTATEGLTFDGSSELDGQFDIKGGKGTDVLIGGALADLLFGNEGQDNLTGGGGNDTFRYRSAADSAIGDEDQILDFTAGDKIDLTMMDANANTVANDAFTFSNDGTFHGIAGELRAYESSPGTWFVEGDRDGGGSADFAIQVSLTNPLAPLVIGDFNL
jgi:large repetitive protein